MDVAVPNDTSNNSNNNNNNNNNDNNNNSMAGRDLGTVTGKPKRDTK